MNFSFHNKDSELQTATLNSLESILDRALKKINSTSENEICRFLPGPNGGYMHHFTLRKMATEEPQKLCDMLHEYIIDNKEPIKLAPKARAARGSRKNKGYIPGMSPKELEEIANFLKESGHGEWAAKLNPYPPLTVLKKELINAIKQNRDASELWSAYNSAKGSTNPNA